MQGSGARAYSISCAAFSTPRQPVPGPECCHHQAVFDGCASRQTYCSDRDLMRLQMQVRDLQMTRRGLALGLSRQFG
jgi:hypothetical protein